MSTVYLAKDTRLERDVALKTILLSEADDPLEFQFRRHALLQEAKLAGRLNHPSIVTIYDSFELHDLVVVTMEFVQGLTLEKASEAALFKGHQGMLRLLLEVSRALDYAHRERVVHRDIKPSNIIIRTSGAGLEEAARVKVADFGIARISSRLSVPGRPAKTTVVGTPGYMSPEQLNGTPADGRSDQFSLAVVAHELLTGKMPFEAADTTVWVQKVLTSEPQLDPSLRPATRSVFSRALSKDRAARYAQCEEFIGDLQRTFQPRQVQPPRPLQSPADISARRRWPYIIGGAVLLVILMVALNWSWLREIAKNWNSPAMNPQDGLEYVWVGAGSFHMGCVLDDPDCDDDEKPRHQVTLTRGFWIGRTEVTVAAYEHFASVGGTGMPEAPSFNPNWHDRTHPIVNVSWNEASAYCEWAGGRLPSEAEWERAARGKHEGLRYPWGNSITHEDANYGEEDGGAGRALGRDRWVNTAPVASFDPNDWGLYDMAGNVMEWVKDWYSDNYFATTPAIDPRGPTTGKGRVIKGGSWQNSPRLLRVSWRIGATQGFKSPYIGFRCVSDEIPQHR